MNKIDEIMLDNLGDTGWNGSLLSKQYQTAQSQLKAEILKVLPTKRNDRETKYDDFSDGIDVGFNEAIDDMCAKLNKLFNVKEKIMYDAERYDTGEKLFKYRTEVFFNTHTSIANFYHMTALGGYIGTLRRVKWHKLTAK